MKNLAIAKYFAGKKPEIQDIPEDEEYKAPAFEDSEDEVKSQFLLSLLKLTLVLLSLLNKCL